MNEIVHNICDKGRRESDSIENGRPNLYCGLYFSYNNEMEWRSLNKSSVCVGMLATID